MKIFVSAGVAFIASLTVFLFVRSYSEYLHAALASGATFFVTFIVANGLARRRSGAKH